MAGLHKICVQGNSVLYKVDPNIKYEMTIQIEALYANMHEEKEQLEQGE